MYNMQSGIRRKSYTVGPQPPEVASRLHSSSNERIVNGLATDALNKLVIASTSDGTINVSENPPFVLSVEMLTETSFLLSLVL